MNQQQKIIDDFHKLYYGSKVWGDGDTRWLGVPVAKCVADLIMYQEIIWQIKPDLIIETGTWLGGSALFFATILDAIGKGEVITIDKKREEISNHTRITYYYSINSVSENAISFVKELITRMKYKTCMVVLDSDHSYPHVLQELRLYSQFVSVGSYMVVEDTNLHGNPLEDDVTDDPMRAVKEFLIENDSFVSDLSCEKFMLTFNPWGWLKRIK